MILIDTSWVSYSPQQKRGKGGLDAAGSIQWPGGAVTLGYHA